MRAFDRAIFLLAGIIGGCVSGCFREQRVKVKLAWPWRLPRESNAQGDSTWHDCIIFDFFYSEYWHNSLSFLFVRKPKSTALRGVWVCVLVIVFCLFWFTAIFPVCFTESLVVYDFTFPKEFNRVTDFRVFDETQDIVIGGACLLLCCDLVKTTAAESLEKALFFVVQAVSCCDFIRTKIEKKEDETSYPA